MQQENLSVIQKKLGKNFHVPTIPPHWRVVGEPVVHDHGFVADVDLTFIDENGKQYPRTLLFRRDAASVLIVARSDNNSESLLMTNQYRLGVGESLIELPGGMIEYAAHETPREAALREFKEEVLGFEHQTLKHVTNLGYYYMDPARSAHNRYVYLVEVDHKATTTPLTGDTAELVEGTMWLTLADVIDLMRRHKIRDALTMAALGDYLARRLTVAGSN